MTTPDPAKAALLEVVLTRAAEEVGDLTAPTMTLFYQRHPDALASFEHHGYGQREQLEASMVENGLYCMMTWLERPAEVSFMLYSSVPHHRDALQVHAEWYRSLLDSLIDVVAETVPAGASKEAALMEEIRTGLAGVIEEALA